MTSMGSISVALALDSKAFIKEIAKSEMELDKLGDSLKESKKTFKEFSDNFASVRNPGKEVTKMLDEMEKTILKNKIAYNTAKESLSDLKKQYKDFKDESKKTQEAAKAENKAVNENISKYDELENKLKKSKEEYTKYAKTMATTEKPTKEMKAKLAQLKDELIKNQKAFNEAQNKVKSYGVSLEEANKTIENLKSSMLKLAGGGSALYAFKKLVDFSNQSVGAYREQERAVTSLNTSLRNAGVFTESYSKHLQDLSAEIQGFSNYGDEAIERAIGLGQAYAGNVRLTDDLIKATIDFAAATETDLQTAFTLVGKSIGTGTNALARYGVALDKNMTKEQKAEAIHKAFAARFKGSARDMSEESIQLQNATTDLAESIGSLLEPSVKKSQKALKDLVVSLKSVADNMKLHPEIIQNTSAILGGVTAFTTFNIVCRGLIPTLTALKAAITGLGFASLFNPIGLASAAIGGFTALAIKSAGELNNMKNATDNYISSLNLETQKTSAVIDEYKTLLTMKQRTADQNKRLAELTEQLTAKYPKYIDKLKEELILKGKISKATAEQIANEMTLAKVKDLEKQKEKVEKTIYNSGNYAQYEKITGETVFLYDDDLTKSYNKIQKELYEQANRKDEIVKKLLGEFSTETNTTTTTTVGTKKDKALDEYKKYIKEFAKLNDNYEATLKAKQYIEGTLNIDPIRQQEKYDQLLQIYQNYYSKMAEIDRSGAKNKADIQKLEEQQLAQQLQELRLNNERDTQRKLYDIAKGYKDERKDLLIKEQAEQELGGFIGKFSTGYQERLQLLQWYYKERETLTQAHFSNLSEQQNAFNELEQLKATKEAEIQRDIWKQRGEEISNILGQTFDTMLTNYGDFSENMQQLVLNLSRYIIKEAFESMITQFSQMQVVQGGLSNIFQTLFGSASSLASSYSQVATSAAIANTSTQTMQVSQAALAPLQAKNSSTMAQSAAKYQQAAAAAQQLATSIAQLAISEAAYSVAKIPFIGGFLTPAAATATGAAIAAALTLISGASLLGKASSAISGIKGSSGNTLLSG